MRVEARPSNQKMAILLGKLRTDEGISIRTLANALDKPNSFITNIESRQRRLDIGEFIYYCRAINQDPDKVLAELIAS